MNSIEDSSQLPCRSVHPSECIVHTNSSCTACAQCRVWCKVKIIYARSFTFSALCRGYYAILSCIFCFVVLISFLLFYFMRWLSLLKPVIGALLIPFTILSLLNEKGEGKQRNHYCGKRIKREQYYGQLSHENSGTWFQIKL